MNRRSFIKSLVLIPTIVAANKVRMALSTPNGIDYKQFMMGIPYHQSNSSTGTWLGISRYPRYNGIIDNIEIPKGY